MKDDDEYFDNWVSPDKFDLLCEPKYKVGLLGSMFMVGCASSCLVIPPLADAFGRKIVFLVVLLIAFIAHMGLLISKNIYEAYVFQFMNGTTMTGRIVIGLSLCIEYLTEESGKDIVFIYLQCHSTYVILITFWYQFIDRGWFLIQLINIIILSLGGLYYLFVVPESPKWLYTWRKYQESKDNLAYVAQFNAVDDDKVEDIKKLEFDKERREKLERGDARES